MLGQYRLGSGLLGVTLACEQKGAVMNEVCLQNPGVF